MFPKLGAQREGDSNKRRVRQRCANVKIGPAFVKTLAGLASRNVDSVVIDAVDLRQRLNEINGVAFVAPKLRPNSMSIDCDPQPVSPVLILPDLLGSSGRSICFYRLRKPGHLPSDVRAYRARGCVRPYLEVHAGSRVWPCGRDLS